MIRALFTTLALFLCANSPIVMDAAGDAVDHGCLTQYSMELSGLFVGDNLPPEQRTMAFAMPSFFIGTGAVVASALPYILQIGLACPIRHPRDDSASVKLSFYIGAVVLFLRCCILC